MENHHVQWENSTISMEDQRFYVHLKTQLSMVMFHGKLLVYQRVLYGTVTYTKMDTKWDVDTMG